ncbi:MAG: hypothetical protein JWN66_2320, partial [Sphingomonas bacterium]|nr:hypothetical protein [Sphingomonas bacterium]
MMQCKRVAASACLESMMSVISA